MEFLDIELNEKLVRNILIGLLVFIVVFLALQMSSLLVFKSYKMGANTTVQAEEINTHIDILEHVGGKLELAGWAYKEGEEIKTFNSSYVIKNKETGKMYRMRTQMEENINIPEEDPNRMKAGLHARCLLAGLPKGEYDILVLYKNDGNDILASTQISVNL